MDIHSAYPAMCAHVCKHLQARTPHAHTCTGEMVLMAPGEVRYLRSL